VLEYHSVACPSDNAKRFAIERLGEVGYEVQVAPFDRNPDRGMFWGQGLLWAWLDQSSSVR
jgi:hypothetical protein